MNKQELINKCKNEEDKLLVSKILDKIKLAKTKNQITNTEFLDMYQKKVTEEVLQAEKYENYIYYYPCENAEKTMLVIYPEKYAEIFNNNKFNFSQFVKLIRVMLPKQLKGQYVHKDYLSGVMKLGVRREKIGDIFVFEDGADIVVGSDICEYIVTNLKQLTRFGKSEIVETNISEIRMPNIQTEEVKITVAAMMAVAGIGWASICALPFAMLSQYIKKGTEGSVMGIFNIFIAGPQVFVCTIVAWIISKCVFLMPGGCINYHWEYTFYIGAACLAVAALVANSVKEKV